MEVAGWLVSWVGMWYPIHKYFPINLISYRVGETKNRFTTYCSKEYIFIRMIFCSGSHSVCALEVSVTPRNLLCIQQHSLI